MMESQVLVSTVRPARNVGDFQRASRFYARLHGLDLRMSGNVAVFRREGRAEQSFAWDFDRSAMRIDDYKQMMNATAIAQEQGVRHITMTCPVIGG